MGNTRGNTYSRNHVTFDPCSTCPDFWNFGFDDSGVFDYKAEVDYILEITSQEQIHFVGHSMGTTQFLVCMIDFDQTISNPYLKSFIFLAIVHLDISV